MKSHLFAFVAAVALATPVLAQPAPGPEPLPPQAPIAAPQDVAYPGVIRLSVDATDLDRHIFRVSESLPVAGAGPLTLLYPKWLPGAHSPTAPLNQFAGLVITANGQPVTWTRDPVDVFAFHVNVPAGVSTLDIEFQFLSPTAGNQGRMMVTPEMLNLEWIDTVLYPAGYFTRRITVQPSVRLPTGWKFASALDGAAQSGDVVDFAPTTLNTLADSPLIAGRYFKSFNLDPKGPAPVRLDVIADSPDELDATPEQIEAHKNLVQQAYKLYGSHHYDHYDFLLWLSDQMGGEGLEHHRSSEDGTYPDYFTDWAKGSAGRDLLAHEYTHSWNGKFRRPADLWTPNFDVPMRDSLLWVYEGQTQYWGYVLAARSGLMSKQDTLDAIAATAAAYGYRPGRVWRPVSDTTNDPIINSRRPIPWLSWQRSEDYYSEGQLVWLDADTLIRERSGGKRSLDDFARTFFGVDNGSYVTKTYTFDDVVAALNKVEPYDWATFLKTRLIDVHPQPPFDGLTRGGYKLVFTDKPSDYYSNIESRRHGIDLSYSIGLGIGREGQITGVMWDSPAFKAGLTIGGKLVAVNGIAYDPDKLKLAITDGKTSHAPIQLLVQTGDHYKTVAIDYHDGLRYPHLERIPGTPDRLGQILTARK